MKKTWKNVWDESKWIDKKIFNKNKYNFSDLLHFNGHIGTPSHSWEQFDLTRWDTILNRTGIDMSDICDVYEIGCGSGAFLYYLKMKNKKINVSGCDMSNKLIKIAKKAIPDGNFNTCEASKFNQKNNKFDLVISNDTFQYFENYEYLKKVIKNSTNILKQDGYLVITELPDESKHDEYIDFRIRKIGRKKYDELYNTNNNNLNHLYYNREKFRLLLEESGYTEIMIFDSFVRKDEDQSYRFDIVAKRKYHE